MGGMVNSLRCHRRERRIVTVMSRSDFNMEAVVQLVSTPDCGSGGREFESHLSPLCPCSLRGRSGGLKIRRILDRYQSGALKNEKNTKYLLLQIHASPLACTFRYCLDRKNGYISHSM